MANDVAPLQKDRQIKYFLRCLKTFLPHQYTPNDSNRMTLAYFTIAGLDLLSLLDTNTTTSPNNNSSSNNNKSNISVAERQGYIDWIYHCQIPSSGGFRGFTGTDFGTDRRSAENECWDPANVPATFFALISLLMLGDDLDRVMKEECLDWLSRMQREDGSFGQVLGWGGQIDGGRDLRFCCCAAGIRYILRGRRKTDESVAGDIDVQKLISYVEACQTYDGGFAESPGNESNAGLTYCAIGTISFLEHLQDEATHLSSITKTGSKSHNDLISWLVSRQTNDLGAEDTNSNDWEDEMREPEETKLNQKRESPSPSLNSMEDKISSLPNLQESSSWPPDQLNYAGFNGRPNKVADTCYCFWVTGSLAMLGQLGLVDAQANRRFLLEKTQHIIGGFGKAVGELPDLLHSYLGLASLGLFGENGIQDVDPMFCASKKVRERLESFSWWKGTENEGDQDIN